ncbi:MAG: hypothetical protein JNK74_15150 [Candidatus Hydrogenedentes bacterium]|nr:hypothetical protein [Candidatus Hydrogenedentota bacterium]
MTGAASGEGLSAAARLLERERRIATIESGQGLLLESSAPGECLACLHGPLLADPARVGLVIVPDETHPLCRAARASALPVRALVVTPHMSDAERRDLGIALQNHTIQLVFVTPERLTQPRFVQFIRGLALRFVALASCQRICGEAPDYLIAYETCRVLSCLFPGVPLLGLADGAMDDVARQTVAGVLGIASEPRTVKVSVEAPLTPAAPPPTSTPRTVAQAPAPVRSSVVPEHYREAFALFEREVPVADVARDLSREEPWVWRALESYIRHSGRSHPFPWVTKPTYMKVSMAAGQAETTNPRLIASVMRGQVNEREVLVILAALDNRNGKG